MKTSDFVKNAYGGGGGTRKSENVSSDSSSLSDKQIRSPVFQKISSDDIKAQNSINKTDKSEAQVWKPAVFNDLSNEKKNFERKESVSENKEIRFEVPSKTVKLQPTATLSTSQQLDNAADYLKNGGLLKVPVKEKLPDGKESVFRRVAKFLILIGEDEAAKIMPHLSESQIEKIIPEIASIRTIDSDEAEVILAEFQSLMQKSRESGGVETAKEILTKAYGAKRAEEMFLKAMPLEGKKPFDYLNDADSERVFQLLKDESAGIQTLVLSRLKPKKSAAVINLMDPEDKKEIVLRLAKMEPVSPEVLRRVDNAMHEKSLKQTSEKAENIDGRNALAQILKKMDAGSESDIIKMLSEDDPDLGQDLRQRLFTLEDVINADDRFVQQKLQQMEESEIAYLLAGKTMEFREKILSNISAGRRAEVREQENILKPMRRSECERITSQFFSALRREYENGHLIIKDRNDDVFV